MKNPKNQILCGVKTELFSATLVHHILSYLKKNKKSKKWLAKRWCKMHPGNSVKTFHLELKEILSEKEFDVLMLSQIYELASLCNIKIEVKINESIV